MGDNKISEAAVELLFDVNRGLISNYTDEQCKDLARASIDALHDLLHPQGEAVPVASQKADLWVQFAENGNIRFFTKDQDRAVEEAFCYGRPLTAYYLNPQPAELSAIPTMADALAAGDGTLHGAVEHWQGRALAAERKLAELSEVSGDSGEFGAEVVGSWAWLRGVIYAIPTRSEPIGGQQATYIELDNVLGWIDEGAKRAAIATTGKKQAGEVQGSREQFEAWARPIGYRTENQHGYYSRQPTRLAWDVWQAALASRQPVVLIAQKVGDYRVTVAEDTITVSHGRDIVFAYSAGDAEPIIARQPVAYKTRSRRMSSIVSAEDFGGDSASMHSAARVAGWEPLYAAHTIATNNGEQNVD